MRAVASRHSYRELPPHSRRRNAGQELYYKRQTEAIATDTEAMETENLWLTALQCLNYGLDSTIIKLAKTC